MERLVRSGSNLAVDLDGITDLSCGLELLRSGPSIDAAKTFIASLERRADECFDTVVAD